MNIIKGLIIIMLCTIFLLNSCYNPNLSESNYEEIKSELICEECNVIIIVIDALRPDHLGCYGYIRETSPNIDSLCKKSIVFENAIAQSTWTKPSVTSLFVSNYVKHHKITSGSPYYGDNDNSSFLPDSALTIAKVLSSYEYKTKALTSNLFIQRSFGLEQGFDEYILTENDKEITKNTIEWISQNKDNKIFLYLHYMAPHADYDPPAKDRLFFKKDYSGSINFAGKHQKYFNSEVKMSDEDIEELVARYDGEIRFIDREIQKILTSLKEQNLSDKTIILLTADHGELLGENGEFGHLIPHNKVVHIPLLIHIPGMARREDKVRIAELIDIAPTLLNILQFEIPNRFRGIDLLSVKNRKEYGFSEIRNWTLIKNQEFIFKTDKKGFELYNIQDDPFELVDLSNDKPEIVQKFQIVLRAFNESETKQKLGSKGVNQDILNRLKALGYVN